MNWNKFYYTLRADHSVEEKRKLDRERSDSVVYLRKGVLAEEQVLRHALHASPSDIHGQFYDLLELLQIAGDAPNTNPWTLLGTYISIFIIYLF
jgi:hypothetical protein